MKEILFYLGHPAHFHLFFNVIQKLQKKTIDVVIVIKSKDVLENLLVENKLRVISIEQLKRKSGIRNIIYYLLKREIRLY